MIDIEKDVDIIKVIKPEMKTDGKLHKTGDLLTFGGWIIFNYTTKLTMCNDNVTKHITKLYTALSKTLSTCPCLEPWLCFRQRFTMIIQNRNKASQTNAVANTAM